MKTRIEMITHSKYVSFKNMRQITVSGEKFEIIIETQYTSLKKHL